MVLLPHVSFDFIFYIEISICVSLQLYLGDVLETVNSHSDLEIRNSSGFT
jgi:hypothetical protein